MIILFEENEILFQTLGLGVLRDAKSCKVKEILNDAFELEMTYPITGSHFSKIKLNRILFTKYSPHKEPQPFRIDSISKPINGVISIKAFHISYDMNGIVVAPISGSTPKTTLDEIQNKALTKHNFVFYSDLTSNKTFKTSNYYNMRALLMGSEESVLEKYDGDIYFDKFNVYLLKTRGSNKGASIRYAKNLKDITHDISYDRLYNGVYPFYHQETQEVTTNVSQDGFKQVYIVGTKPYQDGWFSYTNEGEPYHPIDESPVQVATEGDYYQKVYAWNPTTQRYVQKVYNEMVNLFDWISGMLSNSDKPSWIYVDLSGLPNLVIKTTVAGYYKLSTETEWTYRVKGEVVFQGTIKDITSAMMMYYSEVIPTDKTATETETTSVTHVELDNKIMYLDTDAAKEMKFDRILALDLTSEFDETPDKEKLEAKAKEYIEKNKIGQYKYDTRVSFIDLANTTEAAKYEKMDTIELGDVVNVVYEDSDINIDLRVISTTYDAILDRYENIELGEKPEKLSASSVQTGDNVSSLSNDVGYTDVTTVNKLIAKTVTADLIQAKNANLSKAQIEELQTARIKITGMIEATQFEIDTLVAKLLTADNAIIKQTLEAGTVKVKGDITVTSGAITIESTASGTVFKVDRDGNVTANSVNITGGELNINDNFSVTPDGIMTAIGADIRGRFEAESGSIAGFTIESLESINGNYNALYAGTVGSTGSVLMSPGYSYDGSIAGSDENLMWAFIAGTNFGVTTSGTLYALNAEISGTIHAETGNIGGFTIRNNNLESTNVIIGPNYIKYGNNEQFVVNSNGVVTIQNRPEEGFNSEDWEELIIEEYSETKSYYIGDVIGISVIEAYIIGETPFALDWLSLTEDGEALTPDNRVFYKIVTEGDYEDKLYKWDSEIEEYVLEERDISGGFYICKDYIASSEDLPSPFDLNQWEEYIFEKYDGSKSYNIDDKVEYGWHYYKSKAIIEARQSLTLDSDGLISNNLKAKYAVIEDAEINSGTIASFTIKDDSIYSGISSFDYKGDADGVYIGPDGLRLGKSLKIFPDGRIMSGSKNYDPSLIYRNGEYCTYEDSLYKCIISVINVYIVGETPFASDWLSLTEDGEALTPDSRSFYKIVTEGDYKDKVYKWDDISEKYSSEKDDPYTTGEFDQDIWEKVDNMSFGVDDLGHLTAQSATIIGHIEAGSGYIGNKENGFMITSKSIQNGFTDSLGNIQQTGVYIGTDAIRLGRGVGINVEKTVDFDNLTSNNEVFGSIESEQAELLGCEFQLTYNKVSYNRYIEIKETERFGVENINTDYYHVSNSSFKPINVRDINGSETFSVKKDEWTFITFNDPSLYTAIGYDPFNGAFRGQESQNDAFLLNVGMIVDNSVNISVIYFATENDWKNDTNPIIPVTGGSIEVRASTNYANLLNIVSGVFENNAGPWVKIKIKDDSPEPQETTPVYIVGETPLASDWLSLTEGGEALTPEENVVYEVLTAGEYYQKKYRWNNIANQYSEAIIMDTSSDMSIFESCTAEHNQPKVVLLPANTSSVSITPVKYHNFRLKWRFNDGIDGALDNIKVSDIHMTLRTVPGFVVTSDGFLHAYNAKIYGSIDGDVKIKQGSISILSNNDELVNTLKELIDYDLSDFIFDLSNSFTGPYRYDVDTPPVYGVGDYFYRGSSLFLTRTLFYATADGSWIRNASFVSSITVLDEDIHEDGVYTAGIYYRYGSSKLYQCYKDYPPAYPSSVQQACAILGIEPTFDLETDVNAILEKIPSHGYDPYTKSEMSNLYSLFGLTYNPSTFKVDEDGNLLANSAKIHGSVNITDGSINLNDVFLVDSDGNMTAKSGYIANIKIENYWLGLLQDPGDDQHLPTINDSVIFIGKESANSNALIQTPTINVFDSISIGYWKNIVGPTETQYSDLVSSVDINKIGEITYYSMSKWNASNPTSYEYTMKNCSITSLTHNFGIVRVENNSYDLAHSIRYAYPDTQAIKSPINKEIITAIINFSALESDTLLELRRAYTFSVNDLGVDGLYGASGSNPSLRIIGYNIIGYGNVKIGSASGTLMKSASLAQYIMNDVNTEIQLISGRNISIYMDSSVIPSGSENIVSDYTYFGRSEISIILYMCYYDKD